MENTRVGPFLILERLGSNRRQRVFRARQVEQNLEVALKFVALPKNFKLQQSIDKLRIESNFLKKLTHPNIVQFLGCGVEGDKIFFCTELIDGESIASLLSRRGKMAPDQVVEIGRQLASALHYLHQRDVLHSNLTTEKVILDKNGKAQLADLRLNRARKRRWDQTRNTDVDSAAYMAPEQFSTGATEKSDIYSLGVILYELLTGRLPYAPDTLGRMAKQKQSETAPPVAQHVMNCPVWLDKIVSQMLSSDPRARPHSAKAVVLAFDEIRKIDATKKSTVSQVTGGFNPLTAGHDKSEAKRLLGVRDEKPKPTQPFYQSAWFLALSLLLIAVVFGLALIPTPSSKIIQVAQDYMNSEDPSDWRRGREEVKRIIERGDQDEYFDEAESLYFESMRRTLVQQAEKGQILLFQSQNAKAFGEAVKLQRDEKTKEAIQKFDALIKSVDPRGNERHIYIESQVRVKELREKLGDRENEPAESG